MLARRAVIVLTAALLIGGAVPGGPATPPTWAVEAGQPTTTQEWLLDSPTDEVAIPIEPISIKGPLGVKGTIRIENPTATVVKAVVLDGDKVLATSAPIRVTPSWSKFGVTLGKAVPSGPLRVVLGPVEGAAWPSKGRVQASATAVPAGPTVTSVPTGTRRITVQQAGSTATDLRAHGYLYNPSSPGNPGFYAATNDPLTCQADADIMAAGGVNLVQMSWLPQISNAKPELLQCIDALWGHGIGIAWLVQNGGTYNPRDAWTEAFKVEIQAAVTTVGAHPSAYLWLFGNELEDRDFARDCFFEVGITCGQGKGHQLNDLAQYSHTIDSNHVVGTKVCCTLSTPSGTAGSVIRAGAVPDLDFWGADLYRAGTLTPVLTDLKSWDPDRPLFVAELGDDRFHCSQWGINSQDAEHKSSWTCAVTGSGEDPAEQAAVLAQEWADVEADLATASNPNGAAVGGTAFQYSDSWWFAAAANNCGTAATHDICTIKKIPSADRHGGSPEWYGSAYAQLPEQAGEPRITAPAFTEAVKVWNPSATLPEISGFGTTMPPVGGACRITVSWTTATPATTRLDWGKTLLVTTSTGLSGPGQIVEDNTAYERVFEDLTLTTTHTVTLKNLMSNTAYRMVPRGFDVNYRTAPLAAVNFSSRDGCNPLVTS